MAKNLYQLIPQYLLQRKQSTIVKDVDDHESPLLLEADNVEDLLVEVKRIKNMVIGSRRQKAHFCNLGVVSKLIPIINNEQQDDRLRMECITVLLSLAKGAEEQVYRIISTGAIETLIRGLGNLNLKYVELCLCCLRSLVLSPVCPKDFIYADPAIVPHLLALVDFSIISQTSIATILAECCMKDEQQIYLHSRRAVDILLPALHTGLHKLEHEVLKFYACLCYQNKIVSAQMLSATHNGEDLRQTIVRHLGRDKLLSNRMLAAKCLTYMFRAGALPATDPGIMFRVIPTLVTLCKPERSVAERVAGAEILAYLTEFDVELQKVASITDHCIPTLSSYFKMDYVGYVDYALKPKQKEQLHEACLSAYASLAANDEDIRKRIIETDNMMNQITRGLSSKSAGLQLTAARCLHSLSRSVQQLRTSFQDHAVWKPLMNILREREGNELMNVCSSILCNLLLEFSPSKEPILELGATEILVYLTYSPQVPLRLNAVWGLMNMAFQADPKVKAELILKLGSEQLFGLLRDSVTDIVMKTLGLLRNLLSPKPHIDDIMSQSGEQLIQAVVMSLESDHTAEIKEQTLCILGNVADGYSSKEYIMNNDDILKKIIDYMQHSNLKLQTAALFCVANLLDNDEDENQDRQQKLHAMGAYKIIDQLQLAADPQLAEKAKQTLQLFTLMDK